MWKDWKKKVSDFFYEDVIEDDEEELEPEEAINQSIHRSVTNRTVNTKMTYQYPKEQITPFRFPVIPDHQTEKKLAKGKVNQRNYQLKRNSHRSYKDKDYLIHKYKRKHSVKELEDIPAYIRRRKIEEREQKRKQVENSEDRKEEQTEPIVFNHTRPDELDRVFKIRDGLLKNESEESHMNSLPIQIEIHNSTEHKSEQSKFLPEEEKKLEVQQPIKRTATSEKENHIECRERPNRPSFVHDLIEDNREEYDLPIDELIDNSIDKPIDKLVDEPIDVPNYLLNDPVLPDEDGSAWLYEQQSLLEQTLKHFNIQAKIVNVTQGPSVTRFEIQPALGVKVSKIRNLADDIKLNMAAKDIRIEAPIPGKNTIGIEVPNQYPQVVSLQEIIETKEFIEAPSPLTIALGLTIEGEPLITDIGKMPHGLIAGATGSGKSVCINTILLSLLYKANYKEVKFLLIDPKMVELTPYNGIPHLISPVITDAKAATISLKWAVDEMEDRYEKFVEAGVRNILKYNEKMTKQNRLEDKLPYIVIVIDELADLMIVSPQEVEDAICRIAQKARACGIHLLLATQRPSVDVITGLIKANIPTRIAFSVSSQVDSRTMIDTVGAEKLLGKGDMLFVENGANKSVRLQGPFVSDEEIDRVASYMRSVAKPNYLFEQDQLLLDFQDEEEDELLNEVIAFVVEQNQASTSLLQRRFRIGYNRAARLIDTLQNKGMVSAQNGSKPREVLVTKTQVEDFL